MDPITIGLIVIVLLVVFLFSSYNKFVTIKTQIEASIQEIGNQLKRQADLIPNLVASVKGYMKHEKSIFKDLTDARKGVMDVLDKGDAQSLMNASTKMEKALAPINALFESTPALQAAGPTQDLMNELRDTADKVMYSRRTLIDLTQNYNQMVVTIPSNFIAMIFGFTKQAGLKTPESGEHVEVSTEETKAPMVEL
jgi:LemA protein